MLLKSWLPPGMFHTQGEAIHFQTRSRSLAATPRLFSRRSGDCFSLECVIPDLPPYLCHYKTWEGQAWTLSSFERRQQQGRGQQIPSDFNNQCGDPPHLHGWGTQKSTLLVLLLQNEASSPKRAIWQNQTHPWSVWMDPRRDPSPVCETVEAFILQKPCNTHYCRATGYRSPS